MFILETIITDIEDLNRWFTIVGMFDPNSILQSGSVILIALVIFAETGLLVGLLFPGDTLLIPAGILASHGTLPLWQLLPALTIASIVGYEVGYRVGNVAGPKLFKRNDGFLFRRDYVDKSKDFFAHHGILAITFARFIVYVRTFIPIMAGMAKMNKAKFTFYNIIGGVLWINSVVLASYWLGKKVNGLDKYIVGIVILGMVVSGSGVIYQIFRSKKNRQQVISSIKEELAYLFSKKSK